VYQWLVTLHLLGLVVFVMCHGVSMFVAFRVRRETDRALIAAFLGLSNRATQAMYIGLLMLIVGGLGAAWNANWLTAPWVIASYVVLIVTLVFMWAVAAGYYYPLRDGLEGSEKTPRLDDEALVRTLSTSRRPEVLAVGGFAALVILVWLMVFKPGV
jgi:uncharacterized membrane protein